METIISHINTDSVVNFFVVGFAFVILYVALKKHFNAILQKTNTRLALIEKEFGLIRERSRSNLKIFHKVVDGIDDIVQHVKYSIEEEEKKIQVIDADRACEITEISSLKE